MMKLLKILTVSALLFAGVVTDAAAEVRLPRLFESNMVLQRDAPVNVWGWAAPGEEVQVMINGVSASVRTNKKRQWIVTLPPMAAGGPFEMIIRGKNTIVLSNVLIGDVWICGGQSNMQWRIDQTGYKESDSLFMRNGQVRLFTVHTDMDYMPKEDIKGTGWKTLGNESVQEFSAVAYHFGKYLHQQLHVPIGLISDNLGATAIETWMSNEALLQFPQFNEEMGPIVKAGKNFAELNAAFEKMKPRWYKDHYFKGPGIADKWFAPETDLSEWKPLKVSGNTWEDEPELKDHDGAVWFRTTFDLPENYNEANFRISLSQIDDYDIAWVNGIKIGETFGKHNHRNYTVPVQLLKPEHNVLVVRVFDTGGIGGFTTSPFWGNNILWGDWLYRTGNAVDARKFPQPVVPNATPFSSPGVLYNANVAPLTSFRIKGVIWYQGESNADRAYEYRELFPAMINDWRKQWAQGDFPFLFVQLANYQDEPSVPGESNWAELREAQAMALALPNTGMATAIDLGEAHDIHPQNKYDVGQRLGIAAMKAAYGKPVVSSGPVFRQMQIEENRIIIEFNSTGKGLMTKDKYGYVRGFQVAGNDQQFHWAKAYINRNKVVVTCEYVEKPVAVRYAWSNNPGTLDLYNQEGLPAVPFRSDTWKGVTAGNVFKQGPRF